MAVPSGPNGATGPPPQQSAGPMSAVGPMLANGPQSPAAQAAGMDAQRQQLEATMGRIRDLGELVKQLAAEIPTVADEAQQIQQLLKQMVVKAAQQTPMQTMSGAAVPGAGAPM